MELNYLEAFIAVHSTRSFSNAATMLYLSQPAISRRISLLEQEVGEALFERVRGGVRGGVRLTAAGEAFLPYAQRALATIGDGLEAVRAIQEDASGKVYLALVGTLASTDLTERLQAFRSAHPQIKLRLRTARSTEVSTLVRQGDVHLGLRYYKDGSADLVEKVVWGESQVVVCSAENQLPTNPAHLLDHLKTIPWATYPPRTTVGNVEFTKVTQALRERLGWDSGESIYIDSLTAQKRMIEANFAIGLLPISSIQEELQLGTMQIITLPEAADDIPVVAIRRRDGFTSPATQTLLDLFTTT